jgi:hypothetical protein
MTEQQFQNKEARAIVGTIIIENALLGVTSKAPSTLKTALFLEEACVESLKDAAVTFRSNLQYLQTTFGPAEMNSLMKIYNISTEREKRKKPRKEVDVNISLDKLNLKGIQLLNFTQSEMDLFLEKSELKNQLFPFMDVTSVPLVPMGNAWNNIDQNIASKKEKVLTIDGAKIIAEDLDSNNNDSKVAFGRVLSCVLRYFTLAALSGRIRLSDAYAYMALLLDLSQKYAAHMAIAYDLEFRKRLSNTHDIALLTDEGDKKERCDKVRVAMPEIIEAIVTQKQLEAVKALGNPKGSGKKGKDAGKKGKDGKSSNNRNGPYGKEKGKGKGKNSYEGKGKNNEEWKEKPWTREDWNNWNNSKSSGEAKGSFEEKLKGSKGN